MARCFHRTAVRSRSPGTARFPTRQSPWWKGNWDIYVKLVGVLRVAPAHDGSRHRPGAAPGRRTVARSRTPVRRPLTGPCRRSVWCRRSAAPIARSVTSPSGCQSIWSPDGRYLVAGRAGAPDAAHPTNGIYLIPVEGGEPRAITRPRAPGADLSPAFSPDGHRLAYVSCPGRGPDSDCHVQVVDLDCSIRRGRFTTTADRAAFSGWAGAV